MTTSNTFIAMKTFMAQQLVESVSEAVSSNLYLAFGYSTPWANEASPPLANTSQASSYDFRRNMIGAKKITGNDLSFVIQRNDWTANTVYTEYDVNNTNLYNSNSPFYVYTSGQNVYKCLGNNGGNVSSIMPTSLNTTAPTQTADGYIWKYMYTVSSSDLLKFTTGTYIPVKTLSLNDGSLQWSVQSSAVAGALNVVKITNAGVGYSNVSNINVIILGDGVGAAAAATINSASNTISSIVFNTNGQGYTNASAYITGGGGSGATLKVMVGPQGGHGSDPLYELGCKNIMINSKIIGNENAILPVNFNFREIGILKDPQLAVGGPAANTVHNQTTTLVVSGVGNDYIQNENVYQGQSLDTASFLGTVLVYDSANGILRLTNTVGTIGSQALVGKTSTASKFISSVTYPDLSTNSGRLLYIDYSTPINRDINQSENFKIVLNL